MKTINLKMTMTDASVEYDGSVVLEFIGRTPGNDSRKVRLKMGPSGVGYVARTLHKAVARQQQTIDEVKRALKGEL